MVTLALSSFSSAHKVVGVTINQSSLVCGLLGFIFAFFGTAFPFGRGKKYSIHVEKAI